MNTSDTQISQEIDVETRVCFIISPIGEEGTEVRRRADLVLNYVLKPVLEECGYLWVRADKIAAPGIITSQIIQHILDDPLVIADLTGHNPNVFYELALRHAIRKPVVQIISAGERIPFDVQSNRTIQLDHTDLESADSCKRALIDQIRAVESDPSLADNPISTAIDVQRLRTSGDPSEEAIGEILLMLQGIEGRLARQEEAARRSRLVELRRLTETPIASGLISGIVPPPGSNLLARDPSPLSLGVLERAIRGNATEESSDQS